MGGPGFGGQLIAHPLEGDHQMAVGAPCYACLERCARCFGRGRPHEAAPWLAVGEHLVQHALNVGPLGRRERDPEVPAQRLVAR